MKSGTVDPEKFKTEARQSLRGRKMPKNSPVLNGGDEGILGENDSSNSVVMRQVNLVAAFHDHISCTKSLEHCKFENGSYIDKDARVILPCETDHIYANCSEIKNKTQNINSASPSNNNTKDLTVENMNLRDVIISHLDLISHLQEELQKRDKDIADLKKERDKLKLRLDQSKRERRMCLLRRRYPKVENRDTAASVSDNRNSISNGGKSVTTGGVQNMGVPVLATRYFGRRSKTVPSRALKRRYMGPPKSFPAKQIMVKRESSTASLSSASEQDLISIKQERHDDFTSDMDSLQFSETKVRKKRGRKPKRKMDYLTTDKCYSLQDFTTPTSSVSPPEIDVPSWKLKPVTSFYQMEGTENINDSQFEKRHAKCELDERRRKRWDMQRLREQKAAEKLLGKIGNKTSKHNTQSFFPDSSQIEFIEVTEQLPVLAFGHHIPLFQPCEFSIPWRCDDSSRRGRAPKVT